MSLPSVTYTFVSGTPSDANQVNTNFLDLVNSLTDGTKSLTVNSVGLNGLTASQIVATDGSKILQTLTTATYPSLTELSYVKGVTSAIQTQLNRFTNFGSTAWTPIGTWNTNVTITGSRRRVGDVGQFYVNINLTGAPNATNLSINLPASHTIDTTKFPSNWNGAGIGKVTFFDTSASAYYTGIVTYLTTTTVEIDTMFINTHAGTVFERFSIVNQNEPFVFANGDKIAIYFEVPIVEYA